MKRNLRSGGRRSGGLSLSVFRREPSSTTSISPRWRCWNAPALFVGRTTSSLDIFADGGCARGSRRAHRADPGSSCGLRSISAPARPRSILCGRDPAERPRTWRAGRVCLQQLRRGHHASSTPRTGAIASPLLEDVRQGRPPGRLRCPTWTRTSLPWVPRTSPPRPRPHKRARPSSTPRSRRHGSDDRLGIGAHAIFQMCGRRGGRRGRVRARPIVGGGVCPVSPLQLPRDATEVIIEVLALGLPDTILGDGHGGRFLAGHAGRNAGHAQRRGARRHHAGPAHGGGSPVIYGARRPPWTSDSRRPASAPRLSPSSAPPPRR